MTRRQGPQLPQLGGAEPEGGRAGGADRVGAAVGEVTLAGSHIRGAGVYLWGGGGAGWWLFPRT